MPTFNQLVRKTGFCEKVYRSCAAERLEFFAEESNGRFFSPETWSLHGC